MSSGVIDLPALRVAGGEALEDGSGIRIHGWKIHSKKAPIAKDAQMDHYKAQLRHLSSPVVSLPEQLFADNLLELQHERTGVSISFRAVDALQHWQSGGRAEAVRVGQAAEWLKQREKDVQAHGAITLDYDWTYSTNYRGGLAAPDNPGVEAAWRPAAGPMDRALLMARDPILFYDEVPLYESELDDNGVSQLTAKVRVMPRCWYVLLRFWLRVDKVMVRLRETRVFCAFPTPGSPAAAEEARLGPGPVPSVLREIRDSEGTFAELAAHGAPGDGPAYGDAESAAVALQAIAPIGVKHFATERLELRQLEVEDLQEAL